MTQFSVPQAPRFPDAANAGPGRIVPGVVEVQLRPGVRPEFVRPPSSAAAPALTSANADLEALNAVVREYALVAAEPSFASAAGPDDKAAPAADVPGDGVDLRSFVTLYFPEGVDTEAVAARLRELPDVERAVPVPVAIPPLATVLDEIAVPAVFAAPPVPAADPLVGTSDQVATNPQGQEFQWYVFRCAADQAWNTASGAGVVIADIDWGFRTTHQDLAPRMEMSRAYNAYDGGTDVSWGDTSHGTGSPVWPRPRRTGWGSPGSRTAPPSGPCRPTEGRGSPFPGTRGRTPLNGCAPPTAAAGAR